MEKLINEFESLLKQVNDKADEIINEAEELKSDLDIFEERYETQQRKHEEEIQEFYKPISKHEFYGVSESDFH